MKMLLIVFISSICCGSMDDLLIKNSIQLNEDYNVKVVINGIRSGKGKLVLAIFKDQEGFKHRKPIKRIELNKSELKGNEIVLKLNPGTYGFSVLDDENENNKMDYNFFGIPKEGFGFSNYYHKGFSKPHFDKFKFKIDKNKIKLIDIQLRYV